jgi:para-aminobenzoate synthetase/4-amino-4-deoxychorismate lyase
VEASAAYFGFSDPPAVRESARRALDAHATGSARRERVRLRVTDQGTVSIESAALPVAATAPPRVAVALTPTKRNNRFLFHKTTHRAVYDRHRAEHPDAFDVLLWNEDGELTEFTIGNLVVELDSRRYTPPRECGLLAGTFRAELLERHEITERVVRREDLARATRIWLVNSVREWVEVRVQ